MARSQPDLVLRIAAVYAAGLSILVAVGVVSLRTFDATVYSSQRVRHTYLVKESLGSVLSLLKDIETGARGYAFARHASFLEPYNRGLAGLDLAIFRTRALLRDDPASREREQLKRLDRLEMLARRRAALAGEVVEAARRRSSPERVDRMLLEGKRVMDEIRSLQEAMEDFEEGLLVMRENRTERLTRQARLAVLAAVLAALALVAFAGLSIFRDLRQREKLAEEVRSAREQLQAILDNTPAVVYVKDRDGRFVLVNRRFERLFNVTADSLRGKTDFDIFPFHMAEAFRANDLEVLRTGALVEREELAPHEDGPHTYISLKVPLRSGDGGRSLICGISTDITERKRVERMKDEVVALASHELRTPLTVIQGALNVALEPEGHVAPEERRHVLELALRNSERLLGLIKTYLDLAAIESGETKLAAEPVDLRELLEDAVDGMRHYGAGKDLRFSLKMPVAPVRVLGDAGRLREVIDNLLSNAVKYSPARGSVDVVARTRKGFCRVSVRDRGPGIRAEFAPHLFQAFARDRSLRESHAGTGLGLSLSRALARRMGGSLTYKTKEGVGTKFIFEFPLELPAARRAPGA